MTGLITLYRWRPATCLYPGVGQHDSPLGPLRGVASAWELPCASGAKPSPIFHLKFAWVCFSVALVACRFLVPGRWLPFLRRAARSTRRQVIDGRQIIDGILVLPRIAFRVRSLIGETDTRCIRTTFVYASYVVYGGAPVVGSSVLASPPCMLCVSLEVL